MRHYRLYKLNKRDGSIIKGKDVEAADDKQAVKHASEDEDCPVCEIWRDTERVGTIV